MITQLKIKNYKSLEDVDLQLNDLHVFVGANNSGKSNLFDALQFLSEFSQIGSQALYSRGGFSQLVWQGDQKRTIRFEVNLRLLNQTGELQDARFTLEIGGGPRFNKILNERLESLVDGKPERVFLDLQTGSNNVSVSELNGNASEFGRHDHIYDQFQDESRYGALAAFVKEIRNCTLYNFEASALRRLNPVRQDFRLQPSGENFASVIHSIQSEYADNFKEIESLLRHAAPEIRQLFTSLTKEGQTHLSWQESNSAFRTPAWAMSDGSLRLLGQLAAIFSPHPPALACYEEPENYLHPAWLPLIADALQSAEGQTQVLISTHSPYFLNRFKPEHLIVVEKKNGASQFSRLADPNSVKETLRILGLGELWYSGELGGTP